MKTTRTAIALLLLLFTANYYASAQWYISLGGGYNFNTSALPDYFNAWPLIFSSYNVDQTNISDQNYYSSLGNWIDDSKQTVAYERLSGGLGKGASFSFSAGLKLNEHLSAELGISWLMANKFESVTNYKSNQSVNYYLSSDTNLTVQVGQSTTTYSLKTGARVRFLPGFKVSTTPSKLTWYLKAGLLVTPGGTITLSSDYSGNNTQTVTDITNGNSTVATTN